MHIPAMTPREVIVRRPLLSVVSLIGWTVAAVVLLLAPLYALFEFFETWPAGMILVALWLCVQVPISLWWLHRVWFDRQIQSEALGLGRALLERGQLVPGQHVGWLGGNVVVGYRAPDGTPMSIELRLPRRKRIELFLRKTVPLLIDPSQPEDVVTPYQLDAIFADAKPPSADARPERVAPTPGTLEHEPFVCMLDAHPERVRRSLVVRTLDRIEGLVRRRAPRIPLEVGPDGLTLRRPGEPPIHLDWQQPFVVHRSAQRLDDEFLAVSIELAARWSAPTGAAADLGDAGPAPLALASLESVTADGQAASDAAPREESEAADEVARLLAADGAMPRLAASRAGIEIRVLLPHHAVAASVPLQATRAPWISARDFARLWPLVVGHAELHGLVLDDLALPIRDSDTRAATALEG